MPALYHCFYSLSISARNLKISKGRSIAATIYAYLRDRQTVMLRPPPTMQGQFIERSEEGQAFADRDFL